MKFNDTTRAELPLPGTEQARYRSISNLRDDLRAAASPSAHQPPEHVCADAAILSRLRDDSAAMRFKNIAEFRAWVLGVEV